jgi:hypothetical protein
MAISPESKMSSPDRVLVLKPIEGKKPLNNSGVADPKIFTGENKLHAIMDPLTCLWRLKYDNGVIPEGLKGNFTNFTALKKFAEAFYIKRNIEIVEVKN